MKSIYIILVLFFSICLKSYSQVNNTESFDGTTFVPTGWTNLLVSGTNTWTRVTAGSFPTQTPHSVAGEAQFNSFSVSGGVRALVSPVINYSNRAGAATTVSFWMYRDNGYSTTADKIDIYMNTSANLTGANLLGTVNRAIGLAPIVASNGWYQYSFSVPASYTTTTNYFILKATSAYGNNIFIDDVSWAAFPPPYIDMLATGLISPVGNFNCFSSNQSVSVQIKNNGSVAIDFTNNPITINCSVSIVPSNTSSASSTVVIVPFVLTSGILAIGTTTNVVITNSLNMSISGTYSFTANTTVVGDINSSNDAMPVSSCLVSKVNSFPYSVDFSSIPNPSFLVQQVSGTGLWSSVTTGNMSFPTLAPVMNSSNGYAYFNSFSYSSGTISNLITPIFDMSSLVNPSIDLWVSQDNGYSASNDKLDILISTDGGNTWGASVMTIPRYNASFSTPGWKLFTVPLALYAGLPCVRIAIKATSAYGNNIGIDYLRLYDGGSILPIKLVDFSGSQMSDIENLLVWETAEEVNTKAFLIEYSEDGTNYQSLCSQKAEGEQTGKKYYFIDTIEQALPIVYYRLVSVDNDDSKEIFKVISIEREYVVKNNISLFPNPTSGLVKIQINSEKEDDMLIEIFDGRGNIVKSEAAKIQMGVNTIALELEALNE